MQDSEETFKCISCLIENVAPVNILGGAIILIILDCTMPTRGGVGSVKRWDIFRRWIKKSAPSRSTERSSTQNRSNRNAFVRASPTLPFCMVFNHAGHCSLILVFICFRSWSHWLAHSAPSPFFVGKELSKNNFYNFARDLTDDFVDGTDAAGDSV